MGTVPPEVSPKVSFLLWSAGRSSASSSALGEPGAVAASQLLSPFPLFPSLPSPPRPSSLPHQGHVEFHVPPPQPPFLPSGLFAAARAIFEGLAVSMDLPCSKAFHSSPLPAAEQPNSCICLCQHGPEWSGPRLSLTFIQGSCSTCRAHLTSCHQLARRTTTASSLGSETASLMKALAAAPTEAVTELLGWFPLGQGHIFSYL